MKIISPRNDYQQAPPEQPALVDYHLCPVTRAQHCPCFYNEPSPVIVCPWRCCACMQGGLVTVRSAA